MKHFYIFIIFISSFAYSAPPSHQGHHIIVEKSGNVRLGGYSTTENMIKARSYASDNKDFGKWFNKNINQMPAKTYTGATSNSSLPVSINHSVEKKAVMRGLFQNAKSVGKAAAGLAGKRVWFLMALGYAAPYLAPEGWLYNEDEMEFQKIINSANPHYFIIQSNKSFGYSFPEGGGTKLKVQQICGASSAQCTILSTVQGLNNAGQTRLDICKSKTIKVGNNTYNGDRINGNSGACEGAGYVITYLFLSQLEPQKINLEQEEFDRIILPVADLDPSEPVNYSRPSHDEDPPSLSYVDTTLQTGSQARTDQYTDPYDGKAKQATITINQDGKSAVIAITFRPDLQGDLEAAPVPKDPEVDTETKPETSNASAPVQCDKYPDTLGCEKMGDGSEAESIFSDIKIPEITNPAEFKLDNFLPDNGSCPAPKTYSTSHGSIIYSYEKHCDVARTLRPFLIAFASVTALYLIFFRKA